ncbi:MAG: response regulator [Candidatus Schekmanbacteria bacterium]|nr:response regulator [Candidatus Schekmanbacteria bacterium]
MSANSIKILIIDDDDAILFLLSELFQERGHEVLMLSNPVGASLQISRFLPDVLILDYFMPGLSGSSLAEVLRTTKSLRGIPIVFYSAASRESLAEAARRANARIVEKGEPLSNLVAAVEQAVTATRQARD